MVFLAWVSNRTNVGGGSCSRWPNGQISHIDDRSRKVGLMSTIPNDSLFESAEIRIELYYDSLGRLERKLIYRFVYSL